MRLDPELVHSRSRVLLEALMVVHTAIPWETITANGPYLQPDESSPLPLKLFLYNKF